MGETKLQKQGINPTKRVVDDGENLFLARGSFNEMLRQIYRVYARKTIGNSHGTVIFSAMCCQTRTTSYCWLLEIKR